MCDNCILTLNEHLQLSTTKLRDQLIIEEKKHIKYMDACKPVFQNKDSNHSHNCEDVCRPILKIIGLPKIKKRKTTKVLTPPASPSPSK